MLVPYTDTVQRMTKVEAPPKMEIFFFFFLVDLKRGRCSRCNFMIFFFFGGGGGGGVWGWGGGGGGRTVKHERMIHM
jgi:hypothetical protein